MSEQRPLDFAVAERDAALSTVAANAPGFFERALAAMRELPAGNYTGEGIRLYLSALGITPHHHNAWGALVMVAVRQHIIEPTGYYRPMREVRSHARRTPEYRRLA